MSAVASSTRIDGLDVARAVAVLGMFAAHLGNDGVHGPTAGAWPWLLASHGFPSALFAVLAGVSMTLMLTRRGAVAAVDVDDLTLGRTRVRIAVRGGLLIMLGLFLELFEAPIAIILHHLGLMFLLALPVLRWRTRWLVSLAVVLALTGGWITRTLDGWAANAGISDLPLMDTLWDGSYPAATWMTYILAGLVVGRADLRSRVATAWLGGLGVVILTATSVAAVMLRDAWGENPEWLSSQDHSFTPVEAGRNIGASLAVIAMCLAVARLAPRLTWPLQATGAMALTLYTLQVLVITIVGDWTVREPVNSALVALWLGSIAFASAWKYWVGPGPLERVLTVMSSETADAWEDARSRRDARSR
ncbi:DUF1624 domain-containing protein [Demequina sp. B12]|uniref:heparan-alpha-glucosaminide N-acetyltransferase domain-containing protein n=1 Tax=Demequina sp. B12 TaxID=2992757 RepID=UPI00237A938A|nr:heparan-alpha-glucosaminide N-acetyltransferase domain-containing protein [Demequina sp. B12]MDE0572744.1 DUF1624 domain-containing protein [Demequina sp. B12]